MLRRLGAVDETPRFEPSVPRRDRLRAAIVDRLEAVSVEPPAMGSRATTDATSPTSCWTSSVSDAEPTETEILAEIEAENERHAAERVGITGPVCEAWGPDPDRPICRRGSCWHFMTTTTGPTWWTLDDWPNNAENPY